MTTHGQGDVDTPDSRTYPIQPMCCILCPVSAERKREGSVDWLTQAQIKPDISMFHYANGGTSGVYFRRSGQLQAGKQANLLPVAVLRPNQQTEPLLYVSTTMKFCRALKQICVKGNRQLECNWKGILNDLMCKTFITGHCMYQEIHNAALTAFFKRVNPNSWCNYTPNPTM